MGDSRLEPLVLSDAERQTLRNWARRRTTAQGLALRARIVLAYAEGRNNTAVAARLGGRLADLFGRKVMFMAGLGSLVWQASMIE